MRVTLRDLKAMKRRGEKIAMITAYDYTSARILDQAGLPVLLVGDSLGQVVLGYDSTVSVTMEQMIHHARTVVRGSESAHIVCDMPFMSYQADVADAIRNAGRLMKEAGVQAVKLEGGRDVAETVGRIVRAGIPVMGHISLTPQAVHQLGGYRVQGRSSRAAAALLDDALALEEAGAYSMVLECVPSALAALITERIGIPTIGIGAGPSCDGQVQVFHDMVGLFSDFIPRHARRYADLASTIGEAATRFADDIRSGEFPSVDESFTMDPGILEKLSEAPVPSESSSP